MWLESRIMMKTISIALLPLLLIVNNSPNYSLTGLTQNGSEGNTGTLEKMIVASGSVAMDLDLNRLNGAGVGKHRNRAYCVLTWSAILFLQSLFLTMSCAGRCPAQWHSFLKILLALPARLNASYQQLVVESMPWGGPFDLVVRDGKTGFVFFNIEGHQFDYDANAHLLSIQMGRLLISNEFAAELGRPSDAGASLEISRFHATMRAIEITQIC